MKKIMMVLAMVALLCGLSAQANRIDVSNNQLIYDWSGAAILVPLDSPAYMFRVYESTDATVDFNIAGGIATSGSDTELYTFTWNDTANDAGIYAKTILDSTTVGFNEGSYIYMVLFSSSSLSSGYCAVLRDTAELVHYDGAGFLTHDPTADLEIDGGLQGAGGDWQAIPEPATFGLMVIGAGVAWLVRLKQRYC